MSAPIRNIMRLLEEVVKATGEERLKLAEANREILRSETAAQAALQAIGVYHKRVQRLEKGLAAVRAAQVEEAEAGGRGDES